MAVETSGRRASQWVRYGGLAAIVAAVLELATTLLLGLLFPEALVPGTADAAVVADLVLTYLVLGIVGVAAVYVRYGDAMGLVGTAGLAAIAVGALVGFASVLLTGSIAGTFLNMVLVLGGAALLAVGLWRTPPIPRSAAVLLGVAPVAAVVGIVGFSATPEGILGPLAYVAFNLTWAGAWIVLGYHLWTDRGAVGSA